MSGDIGGITNAKAPANSAALRTTLGLLPLVALSAALTAPAQAQGEIALDEISVLGARTGTGEGYKRDRLQSAKATAPLLNTPQTVTVVPEEVIEERGATDLVEVLRNTPGISIDAGENAFGSGGNSIFLRGMNATGSIFIDGARDNGSYTRDTFNVEQVEVVKGAAADNGRGVGAGFINMVTKTPQLDNFIRGSARIGLDDYGKTRLRGTFDVNQTVDNFAARFNAMAEGGSIFGRDVSRADSWGIAPSFAYGLGTEFSAVIAYEHVERTGIPDVGVTVNRPAPQNGVGIPGFGDRPYMENLPRTTFFGAPTDFENSRSDALLARFAYEITDRITISNQTRWSNVHRDSVYRIPNATAPLPLPPNSPTGRQFYDRTNDTLSNLTNLSAEFETGTWRHTLSTGLEFSRERSDAVRGGDVNNVSTVTVDTAAFYLYDTIELTDRWLVSGGLRAEHYGVDIRSSAADIPGAGASHSETRTTLGGKFGIAYKPRPEGTIYASYGVSHLPHGSLLSNPDISRTGGNAFPGFIAGARPVEAHNYEVGAKWDFFGGNLSVTGALFRTDKKNVAFVGAAGDPAIVYGEQTVQGVELGVAGSITPAWDVFGGLTLLGSERRHGPEVDRALAGDYGANGTFFPAVTTTNGDELAFTPNFTASLWSTYRLANGLTLGGGVQYVSESWIGRPDDATRVIPNGKFGKLPGHFLVNVMAAYELNDNVTLRFNIDNLFNETYLTTTNWNGSWGYLGAPRTYRFGTSFRF